ncbi:hypothetical protein A1Q1_03054 [Trichosporon asahii var. asahii CBS 2479]|uniref:C2H2-type domain-containing protein n=1 Tax=Trichosporon asahii var. asahii (strain ATCC 90039 / CBS 2479 / JCM 2466 / KCTC 7840 / NBRC 103889/ NCYC 2677 / UAMH 7654) TaxID=1186058 RepID=J4UL08_TRIAS|nr:hypothetical protein A1Q1_03054 [Trichosporon asahii var. asahii CBS 2479]EJT52600.1 hypothetical protein A1Q1_03054 [Trichosporon asahii var. asahii CBS 2479]
MMRRGWTKKLLADRAAGKEQQGPTVIPISQMPDEQRTAYLAEISADERPQRWHDACENALLAQPVVAPATTVQPYPGQPSEPGAVGCECFKVLPPQKDIVEHLHLHHVLPKQVDEALEMWGQIHELKTCPWQGCGAHVGEAKEFAAHLASKHEGDHRCMVPTAYMTACNERATAEHLEYHHGLISYEESNEERKSHCGQHLVVYCTVCFRFVRGRMLLTDHMDSHIDEVVTLIKSDDRCLGKGGILSAWRREVFCPKCVHDTTLDPEERLKGYEDLVGHLSTHLIFHKPDTILQCFFPSCSATSTPLDLADHISNHHRIRMFQEDLDGIHGDPGKLMLPTDDPNIQLQMDLHVLPICQ